MQLCSPFGYFDVCLVEIQKLAFSMTSKDAEMLADLGLSWSIHAKAHLDMS